VPRNATFVVLFFICPKNIKAEIDMRAYRGIEEKVPVKVGRTRLINEKTLRERR